MNKASSMPEDQPSFLRATRAFCHLLYQIGSPKVKVAAFLFENTMCYQEFDTSKRITLDEFVQGRKRKDGSRLSSGCGLKQRSHVSEALGELESQQLISVLVDDHDSARQRKFYRLTLPSLDQCPENRDTAILPVPDSGTPPSTTVPKTGTPIDATVPESGTLCSEIGNAVFRNRELDQSKYLKEVPKESTFIAPTVETLPAVYRTAHAAQGDEDGSAVSEKRLKLHELRDKVRKMEKANIIGPYLRSLRDQIRKLEDDLAVDSTPPEPSDSHAPQASASSSDQQESAPGAWLSESSQLTIETCTPDAADADTAYLPTFDAPDADVTQPLFAEAVPPPKVDLFREIGSWFFDLDHISKRDATAVQEVVNRLKARGLTDVADLRWRYEAWVQRFQRLKEKSIYHFEQNVARA